MRSAPNSRTTIQRCSCPMAEPFARSVRCILTCACHSRDSISIVTPIDSASNNYYAEAYSKWRTTKLRNICVVKTTHAFERAYFELVSRERMHCVFIIAAILILGRIIVEVGWIDLQWFLTHRRNGTNSKN
ncbi:hypothetical protein GQ600_6424 [Phytophthora cactorum]|nr:hypothetical protein GQ600_6424 [Phytophthora cactorum]